MRHYRKSLIIAFFFAAGWEAIPQSYEKRIRVVPAEESGAFLKEAKVAVLAGVSEYGKDSRLSPLKYAVRDTDALARILEEQGYSTIVLRDLDASKSGILQALKNAAHALEPGKGTLLFFFSGHGFDVGAKGYLATYGTTATNLSVTGLSLDEVQQEMIRTGAVRRVLWIDACRNDPSKNTATTAARTLSAFQAAAGNRILFSTKKGGVSYENEELKHGVFTYYLLEGLHGPAAGSDGMLTSRDIADYVVANVRTHSLRRNQVQIPYEAGEASGDFLIGKAAASAPVPPAAAPDAVDAGEAKLLISSDTDAVVSVDGKDLGTLQANRPRQVGVSAGAHLVLYSAKTTPASVQRKTVDTKRGEQAVVLLELAEKPPQRDTNQAEPASKGRESESPVGFRLGVAIRNLNTEEFRGMGLPEGGAVPVSRVEPGSVAEGLGIRPGDAVIAVNRRPIANADEFRADVGQLKPGEEFSLRILRANEGVANPQRASQWNSISVSGKVPAIAQSANAVRPAVSVSRYDNPNPPPRVEISPQENDRIAARRTQIEIELTRIDRNVLLWQQQYAQAANSYREAAANGQRVQGQTGTLAAITSGLAGAAMSMNEQRAGQLAQQIETAKVNREAWARRLDAPPPFADYDEVAQAALEDAARGLFEPPFDTKTVKPTLDRALVLKSNLPKAHLLLGYWYWCERQFQAAITEFEMVHRMLPADFEAANMLASAYSEVNESAKAMAVLDEIFRVESRNAQALRTRAEIHALRSNHEAAVSDLTALLGSSRGEPDAHCQRAISFAFLKRAADAKIDMKRCEASTNHWEPLAKGPIEMMNGRPKEAWKQFDAAIRKFNSSSALSDFPEGRIARAAALLEMGDASRALTDLNAAQRFYPWLGRVYLMRAAAKEKLGDTAGAQADRDRAKQ